MGMVASIELVGQHANGNPVTAQELADVLHMNSDSYSAQTIYEYEGRLGFNYEGSYTGYFNLYDIVQNWSKNNHLNLIMATDDDDGVRYYMYEEGKEINLTKRQYSAHARHMLAKINDFEN